MEKLGNYIQQVDIRNQNEEVSLLLGVSIEKAFIPSIANTIGTDMTSYKVVKKGQFAYGPVTSRNGDKVSIALLNEEKCIISSSYIVFEITDTKKLLPEYLMLWFRRTEFDRYARFHSHGSAREIFDWEEMCNVELPIPSIPEQQVIVDSYNDIERRIALKRKINDNLESQAQAAFNAMFISFTNNEYPQIDTPLGQLPSNMVVKQVSTINPRIESGKRPSGGACSYGYPSLGADCAKGLGCYDSSKAKYIPFDYAHRMNKGLVRGYELLAYKDGGKPSEFIPDFTIFGEGYPFDEFAINEHVFLIDFGSPESNWFAYFLFKSRYVYPNLASAGGKSAIPGINQQDLGSLYVIDPTSELAVKFGKEFLPFLKTILINCKELLKLEDVKTGLLAALSR